MQVQKRSWIYSGLAHPPGVVLARPTGKRTGLLDGSKLLLAGDHHAQGLAPPLASLCAERSVALALYLYPPQMLFDVDLATELLVDRVEHFRPMVTVVSFLTDEMSAFASKVGAEVRRQGSRIAWLRPPRAARSLRESLDKAKVPSFHTESLDLKLGQDGKPTVAGYAGWAGELWRWLK